MTESINAFLTQHTTVFGLEVQIGTHSFTFDRVYGCTGLLHLPCLMNVLHHLLMICSKDTMLLFLHMARPDQAKPTPWELLARLHVSFIEILKEEVRDLLDPACVGKLEAGNGHVGKVVTPGKPPVQIREASNRVILLAGSTEVDVRTQKEMAACLEQGSHNRATRSTNMNNQSSHSHAIFTITLEQMNKLDPTFHNDDVSTEHMAEDYLCVQLHLVDLVGSERAKRICSDSMRFKECVHINKGLLALGLTWWK